MSDVYTLKSPDGNVGTLRIDIKLDTWEFTPSETYQGVTPQFIYYAKNGAYTKDDIKEWVLERAPERNYEWIDQLLEKLGLSEYDPYAFFKYNGGRFITDDFYVESIN
jgi:hypothetical protein